MRISLSVTNFSWSGGPEGLAAMLGWLARQADDGGLDTVWVSDHLIQGEPGTEITQEMLEAYTTLGYLAASTLGSGWAPWSLRRLSGRRPCW